MIHNAHCHRGEALFIGLDGFVVVFSEKLDDDDSFVSLMDIETGIGNGTVMKGVIKIDEQSDITFTEETLAKTRTYNQVLFAAIDESLKPFIFSWSAMLDKNMTKQEDEDPVTKMTSFKSVILQSGPLRTCPRHSSYSDATPTSGVRAPVGARIPMLSFALCPSSSCGISMTSPSKFPTT